MMKKLFVLMLVLGLATVVNAVPGYSLKIAITSGPGVAPAQGDYYDAVDSEVTLLPSQTLWIGIYNGIQGTQENGGQQGAFLLGIKRPPANATWTGLWTKYVPPLVGTPGTPDNDYLGVLDFEGSIGLLDTWDIVLTNGNPAEFQGVGVLDAKELLCQTSNPAIVMLLDSDGGIIDTITINIPEPMTISLLGIGGLLLRRRKK
jgi:hypothetical protein